MFYDAEFSYNTSDNIWVLSYKTLLSIHDYRLLIEDKNKTLRLVDCLSYIFQY